MGSDGQLSITAAVHHCPSPAILMLFFTIAQNQKYWVKFAQNYPKQFWNVWKIDKITWNMHSSAKKLLRSGKKPLVEKKRYKRTLRATDGQWWTAVHHCPSVAILMLFFTIAQNQKYWVKFAQNYPKQVWNVWKIVKITRNMHSSAKNLAQIRPKSIGCKKIGIKGHLGPLMGSDGQLVHHCPSPAILMLFFTIAQNQKYWVKFAQNYPKQVWNVWKIDKITWNMHSSAKNLAQIRPKSIGCKKRYKRTLRATDGQWWTAVHHCPSPAILMLFFTIAQNQKYWVKFAQNYPKQVWNVWKIDKITWNMHSSAKKLSDQAKNHWLKKKGIKGHLGPLMDSDGQLSITAAVHHCPSPAILMLFFTIAQNQKYWVKFAQNYPKQVWNVWKIVKITRNMHSSAKNLAQIRPKSIGCKKRYKRTLRATDGQWWTVCPSLPISGYSHAFLYHRTKSKILSEICPKLSKTVLKCVENRQNHLKYAFFR